MAEVLTMRSNTAGRGKAGFEWWPVDKVILSYFALSMLIELAYWTKLPQAPALIALHFLAILPMSLAARAPDGWLVRFFRHWYPLPYVFCCYKEMSILIPVVRGTNADLALARLDRAIWGVHPTVWLERFRSPLLTEILEIVYSGFVPIVLLIAVILWWQRRFNDFRYYAFLIALGFLASYVGYLLVPARGPRFVLAHLQSYELRGLWLFDWLRATLDRLESAHYDCFPSGHTEMAILAWWGSRVISANLFRVLGVYTLGVIFATVYLRYHYTVDLLAGALLAGCLIWITPVIYRALGGTVGGKAAEWTE